MANSTPALEMTEADNIRILEILQQSDLPAGTNLAFMREQFAEAVALARAEGLAEGFQQGKERAALEVDAVSAYNQNQYYRSRGFPKEEHYKHLVEILDSISGKIRALDRLKETETG